MILPRMNSEILKNLLGDSIELVYKGRTESTNNDAKLLARTSSVPVLVVAEEQTGGRGRHGNTFVSPLGGIYMSFAAPLHAIQPDTPLVTSFVAMCVSEAIEEVCNCSVGIKWINDIYVNEQKLAGILVETTDTDSGKSAIVGIGINGYVSPDTGTGVAATCLAEHAESPNLELLCVQIAHKLLSGFARGLNSKSTVEYCRKKSVVLQREISFDLYGKHLRGVAIGLDETGQLLVDVDGLRMVLSSATCNVRVINSDGGTEW